MIQNYFDNVKTFLGSLISNARAREGLGQGHLPFFFSKNHRLAREVGMAGGQKGRGSGGRNLCPPHRLGWESVSAIPASTGRQNRKIFVFLIEKIFARGRLKNVKKIFLFCSSTGERKRWAGQSAKSSGFCSKNVLTSSNRHHFVDKC
ncbi:MAG: hypothetical protein ABIK73_04675 [candidate division WOR-3 bacterium]